MFFSLTFTDNKIEFLTFHLLQYLNMQAFEFEVDQENQNQI